MPSAMQYDPIQKELRHAADLERQTRQKIHSTNARYFYGLHRQPLQPLGNFDDNVIINIAAAAVQESNDFAFPSFPILQLKAGEDTAQEVLLRQMWAWQGDPTVLLKQMALRGALDGHVFVRILPPLNRPHSIAGTTDSAALSTNTQFPELRILPGENIVVFWDADDKSRVLWYELQWQMGRDFYRQDVVNGEGHWLIRDFKRVGSRWEAQSETVWPHALGPIVDWAHLPAPDGYYGQHEFAHAPLNDAINKVASDIARILRYHASPRTIGTGFEGDAMQQTSIDGLWTLPNPEAKVFNLEMNSDLSASMRFLEWLQAQYYKQSRVIAHNAGMEAYKGITNVGLRVAFMPQLQKAETLHRTYGKAIAEISERWLQLMGASVTGKINVEWGDVLPVDSRERVELVERQVALGVMDQRTAAAKLGLELSETPEQTSEGDI